MKASVKKHSMENQSEKKVFLGQIGLQNLDTVTLAQLLSLQKQISWSEKSWNKVPCLPQSRLMFAKVIWPQNSSSSTC